MRYIGRTMEELVDAVPAVSLDDAAALRFSVFLDDAADLAYQHARFHGFDGFLEALAGSLDDADGVAVGKSFGADVVGLIEISVEAAMVEGDV